MKHLLLLFLFLFSFKIQAQNDTTNHFKEGTNKLENYQFEQALDCFKKCDTNNTIHKKIAYCYYKLGQFTQAEHYYNQILITSPKDLTTLNQLANLYAKTYDYNKCMEQYYKLIEVDSSNSYFHKQLASYALKVNKNGTAIEHLNIAHKLNPKDFSVILKIAELYTEFDNKEAADNYLKKGLVLDSTNTQLLVVKTKLAYLKKDYFEIVSVITQSLNYQTDTTLYQLKLLGIANYHLKEYTSAIFFLNRTLKIHKSDVVYYYLGLAYKEVNALQKSRTHFEKAINAGITENIETYYTNLAKVLEADGNYAASIKAYQTAYSYAKNKALLYHLARNYDSYYADKRTALNYYQMYLRQNDTGNKELMDYSEYRIDELRELLHFDLDTID